MVKSLNILIVDDDKSLQKFFKELFEKQGHKVSVLGDPDEALSVVRYKNYDLIFIDCMLPKKNGVDLAVEIKTFISGSALYLMSGIFKDKKFTKEAVDKTKAIEFLEKPLDVERILSISEELVQQNGVSHSDVVDASSLLKKNSKSREEKIEALKQITDCSSLDIPLILKEISHTGWKACLNLSSENTKAEIVFSEGKLSFKSFQSYDMDRKAVLTTLGLDVSSLPEVEHHIGNYIFNYCLTSPHESREVIDNYYFEIMEHLLLSREDFEFSVSDSDLESEVDCNELLSNLNRLFEFNISSEDIADFFAPYMKSKIHWLGDSSNSHYRLITSPVFNSLGGEDLIGLFDKKDSLEQLVAHYGSLSDDLYRTLYLLSVHGYIVFDYVEDKNFSKEKNKMKNILAGVEGKTPEEIFTFIGVNSLMRKSDLEKVFKEFSRSMHPDKYVGMSQDLVDLNTKVYSIVSEAYSTLTDESKKAAYMRSKEERSAENSLKAESIMIEGMQLLQRAKYEDSYKLFQEALGYEKSERNRVYALWAELKLKFSKDFDEDSPRLTDIYSELVSFSTEEKRGDKYQLVLGLYFKAMGDISEAYKCFNHALTYNPNFLEARREVAIIRKMASDKKNSSSNLFTQDISTVLGGLFKKKSG